MFFFFFISTNIPFLVCTPSSLVELTEYFSFVCNSNACERKMHVRNVICSLLLWFIYKLTGLPTDICGNGWLGKMLRTSSLYFGFA